MESDGEAGDDSPVNVGEDVRDQVEESKMDESDSSDDDEGNEGDEVPADDAGDGSSEKDTKSGDFQVLGSGVRRSTQKPVFSSLPPWLAHPVTMEYDLQRHQIALDAVDISHRMRRTLKKNNITSLFPVQAAIIRAVLSSGARSLNYRVGLPARDLCVSAPTGSGKTLAYGIPLVEILAARTKPAIRALVLLPTRDLALQVCQVLTTFSSHTDLKVVLATGQTDFAKEQAVLSSGHVDIVVATPGRLVDHISFTPGFSLHQLQFLVLDEADRLLDQPFQDWLVKVQTAATAPYVQERLAINFSSMEPTTRVVSGQLDRSFRQIRKLLFSATLTQDPEKLSKLMLHRPQLFSIAVGKQDVGMETGNFAGRYSIPSGLTERIIVCDGSQKPLLVYHLVKDKDFQRILCFTGSVDSTHRLYTLLRIMGGISVACFSSQLTRGQRMRLLQDFKQGKYQILICSDAMARGMDIEKVENVLSYDAPQFIKTHIHRMGRTARAGRTGSGYTILRPEEVRHYKIMMRGAGREAFDKLKIGQSDLEAHFDHYQECLSKLQSALREEKHKKHKKASGL